jgi:hypothetical protein
MRLKVGCERVFERPWAKPDPDPAHRAGCIFHEGNMARNAAATLPVSTGPCHRLWVASPAASRHGGVHKKKPAVRGGLFSER